MSTKNAVSIQIPEAELQAVREALATLKTTLGPYMIALSPSERQTVPKMSDGTLPFVEKVMEYARDDSQFLPPYVNLEEMDKDWNVVKGLMPVLRDLQQLESNLNDTVMMAGSEAYVGALSFYNSVKYGAKVNAADAKVIYEDLKQRFQKSRTPSSNGTEI
ncbi:hypothetical protein SAMN04488057_103341 [Cyclobacterium lianum]|uniref:Uncharacterized protein n=1 Tax=Cyclobacterium lianum TaxID=388280 RepID=A0A1M7LM13_9BACT|nr:hypothetical protein [Cyclobacterium lianum]SHM79220.1 hypothetical protein SAMN04488057_103341 [Cyclobacterium lianum]